MKCTLAYYDLGANITAFSTTRHGGYSSGLHGEFNINRYCGDSDAAISRNLDLLSTEIGIDKDRIIMPHQVHGVEIRQIAEDFLGLPTNVKSMVLEGVDALMTNVKGICIGVSTADCIPIILYDPVRQAVAAVHAGWRGTLQRIVQKTIDMLRLTYGTRPENLKAVIGPGISLDAFEVGDEVYEQFASANFDMESISRHETKWHIDLPMCNRLQMEAYGVLTENIVMSGVCTYHNSDDYFSARKLGVQSGRIFTAIILR